MDIGFLHFAAGAASLLLLSNSNAALPSPHEAGAAVGDDSEQSTESRVTTEYDLFRVVVTLVDKAIRKRESQQSCMGTILILRRSLDMKLAKICPDTWWKVEQFIIKHSPFPIVEVRKYDVCINDCCLFHLDLEHSVTCPHCGESRYVNPRAPVSLRKPVRTFNYMPLIPRIRRWFSCPKMSKLLEYGTTRVTHPDVISDIHDGEAFQRLFGEGDGKIPVPL